MSHKYKNQKMSTELYNPEIEKDCTMLSAHPNWVDLGRRERVGPRLARSAGGDDPPKNFGNFPQNRCFCKIPQNQFAPHTQREALGGQSWHAKIQQKALS